MRGLRIVIYFIPLLLIFLAYHFLARLTYHKVADEESLTFAITNEPIGVDPLTEQDPISEEIESMLFDTLLGRSPEMKLEGRLAESWTYSSQASYYFVSPRYAQESWDTFKETKDQWERLGITNAELNGDHLHIDFSHRRPEAAQEVLSLLPEEYVAPISVWDIHTEHSAEPSIRNYMEGAVEGWQIRRIWSERPTMVQVHSAGKEENFTRELGIYYDSNPQLRGRINLIRQIPYIYEPRMRINLRSGVLWHDGRAFSVEDVMHSIKLARTSRRQPVIACGLRSVQSFEAAGPLALVVNYRHQMAQNLEIWEQLQILPAHAKHIYNPAEPGPIVGTGPFRILQWQRGAPIVLGRNPDYFRGMPENQRIVYQRVLENRLLRLLFQTGAIDSYGAQPSTYRYLDSHPEFSLATGPQIEQLQVALNLDHHMFVDPRVRQALAYATDSQELIDGLLAGNGHPVDRLIHPGVFPDLAPLEPVTYDPAKAERLLNEAGWSTMRFGVRYRSGTPLTFRLSVVGTDQLQRELARTLQRQWRRVGVQLQLHMITHGELSLIRTSNADFDAAVIMKPLEPYVDLYGRWHSSEVGPGQGNFSRLRNTSVDDLLARIRMTDDPEETKVLAENLQTQIHELQPCVQIALRTSARVFRKDRLQVVDRSRDGEDGSEVRAVGANDVSLIYDLPWWVKHEVKAEPEPEPKPEGEAEPVAAVLER